MEPNAAILSRLEVLSRDVADLRERVGRLEQSPAAAVERAAPADAGLDPLSMGDLDVGALTGASGLVPAAGRLFLGIAGAFVLRAIADSGFLHPLLAVALAVIYAAFWLLSAIRLAPRSHLMAGAHVLTAVLIIYPMVWETTIRFRALSAGAAAALLAAFTILGLAVTWKRELGEIVWITALAGAFSALGLLAATQNLLVFSTALLAMALAVEAGAAADQWLRVRIPVALAVNLALLVTGWLAGMDKLPDGYAPVPPLAAAALPAALLGIYTASIGFRVFARGKRIRFFEIAQSVAAFAIALFGLLRVTREPVAIGLLCLTGGLICYLAAFGFLARHGQRERTFYAYSTFGLLLLLTGPLLIAGPDGAAVPWIAVAVLLAALAARMESRSLRVHSVVYLAAAAVFSGLAAFSFRALLGAATGGAVFLLLPTAGAVAAYALDAALRKDPPDSLVERALCFATGGVAVWAVLGQAAFWIFPGTASVGIVSRTVLLATAALVLRYVGEHRHHTELTWLVYPLMLFATFKLFAQDFGGQPAALAASLVVIGGTMLLLPKIRHSQPMSKAAAS